MAAICHLGFLYFHSFCEKLKFAPISTSSCENMVKIGRSAADLLHIFKMMAIRHLGFSYFHIFYEKSNLHLFLHRHAKFGEDWTMRSRFIAYF